jgi:serine/threonine protein phosphatase PrpC
MAALLDQTEQQTYVNSMSEFISQGRAGQDYAFSYSAEDGSSWLLAVDGHGSHEPTGGKLPDKDYVTWLKELNWGQLIEEHGLDTITQVQTQTQTWGSTLGIGACIVLARVKDDVVDIRWKGDAECRVYKNGREAYKTPVHKIEDKSEKERYEAEGISYKTHQGWSVNVLNGTECTMKSSKRVSYLGLKEQINISNCLGHAGSTGEAIGCASVDIHQVHDVVVVVGSDGLWDMVADTEVDACDLSRLAFQGANEMVSWAIRRWEQEWDYVWPGQPTKKSRIPERDDVCSATWTRSVVLSEEEQSSKD